jgi:3'-5' exoribonuclease 1
MHLPTFWCDGESSFCIVKFGENWGTKHDLNLNKGRDSDGHYSTVRPFGSATKTEGSWEFGMALARVSPSSLAGHRHPLLQSFFRPFSSDFPLRSSHRRSSPIAAFSLASQSPHAAREGQVMEAPRPSSRRPWKPTCLYYTQGKCTMVRLLPSLQWWSLLAVLKTEWFLSYILDYISLVQMYSTVDI